ncbi:MAG: hypothetical protein QW728_06065 [Thermoplasmata archaeon]
MARRSKTKPNIHRHQQRAGNYKERDGKRGRTTQRKKADPSQFILIMIIVVFIAGVIFFIYLNMQDRASQNPKTTNIDPTQNTDNSTISPMPWWVTYTPTHTIGTGKNSFTVNYGSEYPNAGSVVNHPSWVRNAVASQPLYILAHSNSCYPCRIQEGHAEEVKSRYGAEYEYKDFLTDSQDPYIQSLVQDVYNIYYDPEYPYSIPLSVLITKANVSGSSTIVWQSFVGSTDYSTLETWIKDAIYYFRNAPASRYPSEKMGLSSRENNTTDIQILNVTCIPQIASSEERVNISVLLSGSGISSVTISYCGAFCSLPFRMEFDGIRYWHSTIAGSYKNNTVFYHIVARAGNSTSVYYDGFFTVTGLSEGNGNETSTDRNSPMQLLVMITAAAFFSVCTMALLSRRKNLLSL